MCSQPLRTLAFVDGFNLYHAIDNRVRTEPKLNHLKWLDLWALCETFAPAPYYSLDRVFYFSAFATWMKGPFHRHQAYTSALRATGVETVMGCFKEKDRKCKSCGDEWVAHEEKESDVALGAHVVFHAFENSYDQALVVSADSDLAPVVRLVRRRFPDKKIKVLVPPDLKGGNELWGAAGGKKNCRKIGWVHIERCQLPDSIRNEAGLTAAVRPREYKRP